MPTKEKEKMLCLDDLRHAEYYGMQNTFDSLYAKSCRGEIFSNLMELILSRENILLAYRNIKANKGSMTPGTDKLTIRDIGAIPPDEVVSRVKYIITGRKQGYQPRMVRRKDIPKPYDPTKSRPLGIPCIWDRLIQQCIKQVMEPICEAKFSDNSFGFRPNRSVENAISFTQNRMQLSHLHYVIEFDVKGFFDNVNHAKLIRQIWAMGIRDKHLIFVIKRILKAPIKMPDGTLVHPTKGTPQGGIISPLLANIVLNELDHWIESQWQENPIANKYAMDRGKKGIDKGNGYRVMRKTKLKEMYIVRYADDFRVFCRTKSDAEKTMIAVTEWLSQRLKLEVSQEKTRIVNVKRRYSEFLGFKLKVHPVGGKHVVQSHVSDKQLARKRENLSSQAKNIATPRTGKTEQDEVRLYNSMVRYRVLADGIWYHIDEESGSIEFGPDEIVMPKRMKAPELEDWYSLQYEDASDQEDRYNLAQIMYEITGCIMPRKLDRYVPALAKLDRYGITGKRALHPLMYCMTLLGEARNQTKHFYDVSDLDSDENGEDSEQERTSDHDYETELQALRAEVKALKQQLYETGREVRDEKTRYEALAQKTADDAQELHDLRELVFNQQTEPFDEPERPANITFPYRTDRRIVVFGGHDSWAREMKPRFPDVRFVDREMQPNSDMIRRADVVWIQANALAHKHFDRIIDEVRKNGIPLRYFTYAGVNKCSEQLALEDMKAR